MKIRLPELLLLESIFFAGLWLIDDYVGFILTLTCSSILLATLGIALVSERIEKSKVPRKFFWWLFWAIFPPIIVGVIYTFFIGGQYGWLQEM